MNRYALIKDNIVENIIIVDNLSDYHPDEGFSLVPADDFCTIKDKFDNGKFVPNLDYLSEQARVRRNKLLTETDLLVIPDRFATLSVEKQEKVLEYRQSLRDITKQDDFPLNIVWPKAIEV